MLMNKFIQTLVGADDAHEQMNPDISQQKARDPGTRARTW
jgi:hypothetical protein